MGARRGHGLLSQCGYSRLEFGHNRAPRSRKDGGHGQCDEAAARSVPVSEIADDASTKLGWPRSEDYPAFQINERWSSRVAIGLAAPDKPPLAFSADKGARYRAPARGRGDRTTSAVIRHAHERARLAISPSSSTATCCASRASPQANAGSHEPPPTTATS